MKWLILPIAALSLGGRPANAATGAGAGFTEVPSIAAMLRLPGSSSPVQVHSYYGTNDSFGRAWGGGDFYWRATNSVATNFGTCFAGHSGGYWQRELPNPNELELAWFGVVGSKDRVSRMTIYDFTPQVQNAIDTLLAYGILRVPDMQIGVAQIVISNRYGLTLAGAGQPHGGRNGLTGPGFYYCLNQPTNTLIQVYNSGQITIEGLELSSNPAKFNTTNIAAVMIDVDQFPGHTTTTTDNTFRNLCLNNQAATNSPQWIGIRLSHTSRDNVEFQKIEDCVFYGGYDRSNAYNGTAIYLGANGNAFNDQFSHLEWGNCARGIVLLQGSFTLDGYLGEYCPLDFALGNATGAVCIRNGRSESPNQFLTYSTGRAGITVEHCSVDMAFSNAAPLIVGFTNAVSGGYCQLTLINNFFGLVPGAPVFGFHGWATGSLLVSLGNNYFHTSLASLGFNQAGQVFSAGDYVPGGLGTNGNLLTSFPLSYVMHTNSYSWVSTNATWGLHLTPWAGDGLTIATNGVVSADLFSGSGARLTNIPPSAVTNAPGFWAASPGAGGGHGNTAPPSCIYYFLASGAPGGRTTPAQRGMVFANVWLTNACAVCLSNTTTKNNVIVSSGAGATNSYLLSLPCAPGDAIQLTNLAGSANVWLGTNYWLGM